MDAGTQNLILGVIGAAGGGLGVGWIAKLFFGNYITTNDEKHKIARDDTKALSTMISQLITDIAVINTKLDSIHGIGEKVVILEQTCNKQGRDITAAFEKIRGIS